MITDGNLRVSNAQDLSTLTGTQASTNSVDLLAAQDIGEGDELFAVFTVGTAFTTLTSLTFNVISSAAANLGTSTILASSAAIAQASLTAKSQFVVPIPPKIASLGQRYLGASYTIAGSAPGAGTVTCDIVTDIQDGKKYYTSGFSVT